MAQTIPASSSLSHLPKLTTRELDHFDYLEKVRHWTRTDAWKPGGTKLVFKNPVITIGDVSVENGNIVRSKPIVGRPCFGIATALLRYEHQRRYVKNRGHLPAGRCHGCKAKEACRWVVEKRLQAEPTLETAWIDWLKAGGQSAFQMPHFERSYAYRCWVALVRELTRHPFTSVNDRLIVDSYAEFDQSRRERDKERKALARRKARRTGDLDAADIDLLEVAARRRGIEIIKAWSDPEGPKQLRRIPRSSLVEMMEVWLGREVMRARKSKTNAPNIARWIVETNRRNGSANHAALSSRVHKDLKRIESIERLHWNGERLLPALNRRSEFPSQLEADHDVGETL